MIRPSLAKIATYAVASLALLAVIAFCAGTLVADM